MMRSDLITDPDSSGKNSAEARMMRCMRQRRPWKGYEASSVLQLHLTTTTITTANNHPDADT